MDSTEYIKRAIKNDSNYEAVKGRVQDTEQLRMVHGALGMSGETGEVVDLIKKSLVYGKPLDRDKLKHELGDVLWYMAVILDNIGSSFEEVMAMNVAKLDARFPNGFTEQAAIERKDMK